LEVDEIQYNLGILQKDIFESYKIDHFIAWGKNNKSYKLLISGGGPNANIHISGYIEKEETEENQEFNIGEIMENEENQLEINEETNIPIIKSSKNSEESIINKRKLIDNNEDKVFEKQEEYLSDDNLFEDEGDEEIEKLLMKKRKSSDKDSKIILPQKLNEIEHVQENKQKFNKFQNNNNKNFKNNQNMQKGRFNNNQKNFSGNNKKQFFNRK
jgi:hypothetical protein